MDIYIEQSLEPADEAYLLDRLPDLSPRFGRALTPAGRAAAVDGAEVIFGSPPADAIVASPSLRWLHLGSAGFNKYRGLAGQHLPFTITNSAGLFGTPVAETAVAGILALLRGVPDFVRLQDARTWEGAATRPGLGKLTGSRVLILGQGSIGGTVRDILQGFGCRVALMGRSAPADFTTPAELDARLPQADIVVAALPETRATIGLFDAARLALMPAHCVFVNVGRGSLTDEDALRQMLLAGKLGGAVLDVTRHEPLPKDDPLWDTPRTLLTQHSAGGASDENRLLVDRFLENLARYRAGSALLNRVDLARGY